MPSFNINIFLFKVGEKVTIKKIKLRRRYKVLLWFLIIFVFIVIYTYYFEPNRLIVYEYKVENKKLSPNFHGTKIVHLSDIHYGRTIKDKQLKRIVKEINKINPDIVIFTGDLIDKDTILTTKMTNLLSTELNNIKATLGKYAVTGNHDAYFPSYSDILTKSDFILLNNDYNLIYNKGYDPILIGGINTNKEIDLTPIVTYLKPNEETINNLFTIILMHIPDYIDHILEELPIDLALAGHSHNGQFRIPGVKPIFAPTGAKKYYAPYYHINNTDFFISSGLGTSLINIRSFNPPSFNLYRLTKASK